MRTILGIGAALTLLLPGEPASAWFDRDRVTAPWCLAYSDQSGMIECAYYTFEQCQVTRLGVGGSCQPNPAAYVPQRPRARTDRYRP